MSDTDTEPMVCELCSQASATEAYEIALERARAEGYENGFDAGLRDGHRTAWNELMSQPLEPNNDYARGRRDAMLAYNRMMSREGRL